MWMTIRYMIESLITKYVKTKDLDSYKKALIDVSIPEIWVCKG